MTRLQLLRTAHLTKDEPALVTLHRDDVRALVTVALDALSIEPPSRADAAAAAESLLAEVAAG